MKYTAGLLVSVLALILAAVNAADEPATPGAPADPSVESATEPEEDEDDEDKEEPEDDDTFDGRKRIAQTLEFCLRKGDLTPVELVNCASDVLLGGNMNPNPAFTKCVGEYVTCTGVICAAVMAENEAKGANFTKAFSVGQRCQGIESILRGRNEPPQTSAVYVDASGPRKVRANAHLAAVSRELHTQSRQVRNQKHTNPKHQRTLMGSTASRNSVSSRPGPGAPPAARRVSDVSLTAGADGGIDITFISQQMTRPRRIFNYVLVVAAAATAAAQEPTPAMLMALLDNPAANRNLVETVVDCLEDPTGRKTTAAFFRCVNDHLHVHQKTKLDSIGFILGNYLIKSTIKYATTAEGDMLERTKAFGDCIPVLLRNLFGVEEFSFSCRKRTLVEGYDDPDDMDFDEEFAAMEN